MKERNVSSWTFSQDGNLLASGSRDGIITLWNASSGTEIKTIKGHTGSVWSVAFSPDNNTLASGSDDGTVRLWDVPSGELKYYEK